MSRKRLHWPVKVARPRPEAVSTKCPQDAEWKPAEKLRPGDTLVFATGMRQHHWRISGVARNPRDQSRVVLVGELPKPSPLKGVYDIPPRSVAPTWTYRVGDRVQVLPRGARVHIS